MNKLCNTEKVRIPAIKVITINDNRIIHIDDQIFGKLVIRLIDDNTNELVDGCEVSIPDYSGEYGCFVTVPKAWINKKVLVKYEREVDATLLHISPDDWFNRVSYFVRPRKINIDGLTIDYAEGDKFFYYYVME